MAAATFITFQTGNSAYIILTANFLILSKYLIK